MQNPVVSDPLFVRTEDQCHYCSCSEKKKSRSSYTTTISSETSGEHLKVCSPVTGSCSPKKVTVLSIMWAEIGCLHLGEELGLWGTLGPPCGVLMPWQLRVTSRQMIAVLPEPALPTMTAPRPSQLLVLLRTSSRRVKTQSRPMKAVSAVMPGTSNSSGFSITSACLNGISLPGGVDWLKLMWRTEQLNFSILTPIPQYMAFPVRQWGKNGKRSVLG